MFGRPSTSSPTFGGSLAADAAALERSETSGSDPVLPSSFRVGRGGSGQHCRPAGSRGGHEVAAWLRSPRPAVGCDMRHAAIEFRSEHYLTIDGKRRQLRRSAVRAYRTGDGRVCAAAYEFSAPPRCVLKLLGCAPTREAIESALGKWDAVAFETEAYQHSCVVAAMRTPEQWAQHPHATRLPRFPSSRS